MKKLSKKRFVMSDSFVTLYTSEGKTNGAGNSCGGKSNGTQGGSTCGSKTNNSGSGC